MSAAINVVEGLNVTAERLEAREWNPLKIAYPLKWASMEKLHGAEKMQKFMEDYMDDSQDGRISLKLAWLAEEGCLRNKKDSK